MLLNSKKGSLLLHFDIFFSSSQKHGAGVFASSSHKRHVIKTGSMIQFLVKR